MKPAHLTLVALALFAGCVSPRIYQARKDRIDVHGIEAAKGQLTAVLQRSTLPRVGAVEITPGYIRIRHITIGPFDQPLGGQTIVTHIDWAQFDRVDIYENQRAFVYALGAEKCWFQFPTMADAEAFADLMESFSALAKRR